MWARMDELKTFDNMIDCLNVVRGVTMQNFELTEIGVVHSPYKMMSEAPHQGRVSEDLVTLEVYPEFSEGLVALGERNTHLIVVYWQDRAERKVSTQTAWFSEESMGTFALRTPHRPNPIGLCVAEIVKIEGNMIVVKGMDALDDSPLLDIKPYGPLFDSVPEAVFDGPTLEHLRGHIHHHGDGKYHHHYHGEGHHHDHDHGHDHDHDHHHDDEHHASDGHYHHSHEHHHHVGDSHYHHSHPHHHGDGHDHHGHGHDHDHRHDDDQHHDGDGNYHHSH